MDLLIATMNKGKIKEFREILGADRFTWTDLSQHTGVTEPEETGKTFRANACLKATYYATKFGMAALADDSGLEVDALAGSPGVYSARWAAMHQTGSGDGANNALLLNQLAQGPDEKRTARFVCCLALSDADGNIMLTARDTVEGHIIRSPRGENGFGYDPLFFVNALQRTTAELSPNEKHRISHRGKALARLRQLMAAHF